MFEVTVRSDFGSAHNLRGYKGKCEDLHGHNWKVSVSACSETLDGLGMVVDFKELKEILEKVIFDLDHKYLNEIKPFDEINPTSENIAKYIFDSIVKQKNSICLKEVIVWETDSSCAKYSG